LWAFSLVHHEGREGHEEKKGNNVICKPHLLSFVIFLPFFVNFVSPPLLRPYSSSTVKQTSRLFHWSTTKGTKDTKKRKGIL